MRRQFSDVPFGLAFRPRRDVIRHVAAPRQTWLWGAGSVPVDAPLISYDEWLVNGFQVQAHYTDSVTTPVASEEALVRWIDVFASDG